MTTKRVNSVPGIRDVESANSIIELIDTTLSTGLVAHHDSTNTQITAPDATDLATLKTLILALTNSQVAHGLDVAQHSAADAAMDVPAGFTSHPSEPADLAECQAANNQLKADLNTHLLNATPHRGVGGQGGFSPTQIATTDGSDQATNETLANALKDAYNRHYNSGVKTYQRIPV